MEERLQIIQSHLISTELKECFLLDVSLASSIDRSGPKTLLIEIVSFFSVWKAHVRQHGLFQKHSVTITHIF